MLRALRRPAGLATAVGLLLTSLICLHCYVSRGNSAPLPPTAEEPVTVVEHHTDAPHPKTYADVDTVEQYSKFNFHPPWVKSKGFWDRNFEDRYMLINSQRPKIPLKVILVPHSHVDAGWLQTYEDYFDLKVRNILNHMASKMSSLQNMTFIWSEVSFLARWWDGATEAEKSMVRRLLEEGRLEITTGGWVMADEATSHVYAMLDQLIEGHQWLRDTLGVVPTHGWSVDTFGHGPMVPYLLRGAGVTGGTVIQRIHYAWKQWLAERQMGDFIWRQNWDGNGRTDMLVHNQPFDVYSIKHSCGPHPRICLDFDFQDSAPITNQNVRQKAELLLEQLGRTGSLFPHNVVLMPIGDDFRYVQEIEWEHQYHNYKKIIDYLDQNRNTHKAEVFFGTVKDYFQAIKDRTRDFMILRGDFFTYSDVFTEGRPAYWSGYYTTRPYWKVLDRELEAGLRSAEVLYTFALNNARKQGYNKTLKVLERLYLKMVMARQNLALFQHHDAITGTSKFFVMRDYGLKLYQSIQETLTVQWYSAQTLLFGEQSASQKSSGAKLLVPDTNRESYDNLPNKIPLKINRGYFKKIVVFNSLAQFRQDVIKLHVLTPNLRVVDYKGNLVLYQINPVWNFTKNSSKQPMRLSETHYELVFVTEMPPLSITTYTIEYSNDKNFDFRSIIYCQWCVNHTEFDFKKMPKGDLQIENNILKLDLDERSGFLRTITKKSNNRTTPCNISFSAYPSAEFHSGPYLFMPDPNSEETEKDVLKSYAGQKLAIISGPVFSQLIVSYGNLLSHTVRLYHKPEPLSHAVYIENIIELEPPPTHSETEIFMRIVSDINNGEPPEFYTDLNGFQMQRRVKVDRIGIEGNYYPVTTMAFIQDAQRRVSLLVDHAQGAAAWQPGWLELMLERRMLYDDTRGMGEGIVDNKRTLSKYWLLLENLYGTDEFTKPSLVANYLSLGMMYPTNVFVLEPKSESRVNLPNRLDLISRPLPCDVHLLNFRTLSHPSLPKFPSSSALLVLHRQGFASNAAIDVSIPNCGVQMSSGAFYPGTLFTDINTSSIVQTSLTGLQRLGSIKTLDNVSILPMDMVTLNVTFDQ